MLLIQSPWRAVCAVALAVAVTGAVCAALESFTLLYTVLCSIALLAGGASRRVAYLRPNTQIPKC